jgi:hypothetical protein
MSIRLDTLDDRPELIATIEGKEYGFGELPIGKRADLQAYLRRTTPHPIDAVKPHLEGLRPEDRQALLENARREARSWPPDLGTPAGMMALTSTTEGQIEVLAAALSVHHPECGREDAVRLYRALEREAAREAMAARRRGEPYDGRGTARRIYSVIFGMGDPEVAEPLPLPEGSGPDRTASIGATSTGPATSGSGSTNGRSAATR